MGLGTIESVAIASTNSVELMVASWPVQSEGESAESPLMPLVSLVVRYMKSGVAMNVEREEPKQRLFHRRRWRSF